MAAMAGDAVAIGRDRREMERDVVAIGRDRPEMERKVEMAREPAEEHGCERGVS